MLGASDREKVSTFTFAIFQPDRVMMEVEQFPRRCCGGRPVMRIAATTLATALTLLVAPTGLFSQNADNSLNQLAQSFKPLIISSLPATLYEKSENWGHQVMVPVGVKWRGVKPQIAKSPRDHGEWKKVVISAQ